MAAAYIPFPSLADWVTSYDGSVVDEFGAQITAARQEYGDAAADRAREVATRYAAVDTGAIEGLYATNRGFTRTIAERSANWEAALTAHPEAEHHIRDALAGYEYVLDAVTGQGMITQVWIRQLHEVLCASQEAHTVYVEIAGTLHAQKRPLPKGEYKSEPYYPMNVDTGVVHHYAPVEDTPAEMGRLVEELTSPVFLAAHPVVQAAYAHYAFVCVHPFADGNGRVARALASVFLYRRPGVPLVIFADQTTAYLDALEAADSGRSEAFVSFVEQRAIDAANLVLATIPTVMASRDDLNRALREDPATFVLPPRRDRQTSQARAILATAVAGELAEFALPSGITAAYDDQAPGIRMVRIRPPDADPLGVHLQWDIGEGCRVSLTLEIAINDRAWPTDGSPSQREPVLTILAGSDTALDKLPVWLRDVFPTVSQAFEHRLRAWIRGRLHEMARELAVLVREHRAAGEG